MPVMPNEFVCTITERYIELYEIITGKKFVRNSSVNLLGDIEATVRALGL
jgi:phosphoribosylaminoimidazole-succinocarboxamide synthase